MTVNVIPKGEFAELFVEGVRNTHKTLHFSKSDSKMKDSRIVDRITHFCTGEKCPFLKFSHWKFAGEGRRKTVFSVRKSKFSPKIAVVIDKLLDSSPSSSISRRAFELVQKLYSDKQQKNIIRPIQWMQHNLRDYSFYAWCPYTLLDILSMTGPYKNHNKGMNLQKALKISKQIFEGINFLHSRNIIHGDIKLENLLLASNGCIKIIDFDFPVVSKNVYQPHPHQYLCTLSYRAPELACGQSFNASIDIWSATVATVHLITGRTLFLCTDNKTLMKAIDSLHQSLNGGCDLFATEMIYRHGEEERLHGSQLNYDTFDNIMKQCLSMQPDKRPAASETLQAFSILKFSLNSEKIH